MLVLLLFDGLVDEQPLADETEEKVEDDAEDAIVRMPAITSSTRTKRCARIIMAPTPSVAAMISAMTK